MKTSIIQITLLIIFSFQIELKAQDPHYEVEIENSIGVYGADSPPSKSDNTVVVSSQHFQCQFFKEEEFTDQSESIPETNSFDLKMKSIFYETFITNGLPSDKRTNYTYYFAPLYDVY